MTAALPTVTALELVQEGAWLTLWLDQPETRNALTVTMTDDLHRVLAAVRERSDIRGITLRGRHGVFCAGGDLKAFKADYAREDSRAAIVERSKDAARLFDAVNTMPQVVIAVVEGAAVAGGFGLACCADVVVCASDATFAMTETMIGLSPAQISPFVVQRMGAATARRLMLTGARFDGREAQELGFADFIGESTEALEAIEQRVRTQGLRGAPGAIAETKALLLALPTMDRAQTVQAAAETFANRILSDEGREGLASFTEKRRPAWAVKP